MSHFLGSEHLPGNSLLLLFLLPVVMLIGLVVKHYERLFLGCASNSNGLLVLVEGDFADDLVKTNGGLFIFLTFIRLWLWLYIALRILFVEMLFGVFL
jgi:hypothetical protein